MTTPRETVRVVDHPADTVLTTVGVLPAAAVRAVRQEFFAGNGDIVVRTDRYLEDGGNWVGNDIELKVNPKNLPG